MRGPENMCDSEMQSSPSSSAHRELNKSVDFSDYMWMVEEGIEDFDRKCEEEFWEEYWLQEAFEEMLEEEEVSSTHYYMPPQEDALPESMGPLVHEYYPHVTGIEAELNDLNFNDATVDIPDGTPSDENANDDGGIVLSTTPLNPEAPIFIPRHMQECSPSTTPAVEPGESADR